MRLRVAIPVSLALLLSAAGARCATSSSKPAARSAAAKPARASHSAAKASSSTAAKTARTKKTTRRSKGRERGQKAPAADRITEIQQALAKDGSFAGTPNGRWDDSTVEAMRKFQAAHGLNPSGKLDALTLHKLGLGAQTAGIAAPLPVNSSSLTKGSATVTANRN